MSTATAERPAAKPAGASKNLLLSKSKVRAFVKGKLQFRFAGDAIEALNSKVQEILTLAASNAKGAKRATIKASDIEAITPSIPTEPAGGTQS